MKNKDLLNSIASIDEDLLELCNRDYTPQVKRKHTHYKSFILISACFLLLFVGTFIYYSNQDTHTSYQPTQETTTMYVFNSDKSINYSQLTNNDDGFNLLKGNGLADIALFSEKMLRDDELIFEGTVTDTYIKNYRFVVETDGKFENSENKTKIEYTPKSLITTIKIDKIWKGDGQIATGDTITIEDELTFADGIFGYRTSTVYLFHLNKLPDSNKLNCGQTYDETLIEGDNCREFCYQNSYPYQPPIEKTVQGDYIVPDTWKTLTEKNTMDVIVNFDDSDTFSAQLYSKKMKLVSAGMFNKKMQALIDSAEK